jgi:preprotein translocase subunit SecB
MRQRSDEEEIGNSAEGAASDPGETGIRLSLVWLVSSSFVDHGHTALINGGAAVEPGDTVKLTPSANVWLNDNQAAIVQLGVRVTPTRESTFEAEATYAAHYTVAGPSPVLSISEFAWGNGLANLVPFVRAKLVQLTSESRFPTFYLQPMNLAAFQAVATAGDEAEEE